MLESIRQSVALPRVSLTWVYSVAVVLTFFWLLAHDQIHPAVIHLTQLFLMI
jgi:hypothetical protein